MKLLSPSRQPLFRMIRQMIFLTPPSNASQVQALLGHPSEVDVAAPLADRGLGSLPTWMGVFRVCQARGAGRGHPEAQWTGHSPRRKCGNQG